MEELVQLLLALFILLKHAAVAQHPVAHLANLPADQRFCFILMLHSAVCLQELLCPFPVGRVFRQIAPAHQVGLQFGRAE